MNKLKDIKNKYITEENMFTIMVTVMIFFIFLMVWVWVKPILEIKIGLSIILLISLYYQIMSIKYSVNIAMMGMKAEDKSINEMTYQTIKKGYIISFYYDKENKIRIKSYSCSKNKMRYIKLISFIHVLLKPAWWYREDIEEIIE